MKQTFEITVSSPYGKRPVEQFEHFMNKVADDALTRWGIEISISKEGSEEASMEDFD